MLKPSKKPMAKRSGFVYKKPSPTVLRENAEKAGQGNFASPFRNGIDTYKTKDGANYIRILPRVDDRQSYWGFSVFVHYLSLDGSGGGTYLCPLKMRNKPCPICQAARDAKNSGDTQEATDLSPKERVLCWVVDRDDDDLQPAVFSMARTVADNISTLSVSKRTGEILYIDDPDTGYDISFDRSGKGKKTKYQAIAIDRSPSTIADDEKRQDKILAFISENPLPDILRFETTKHLQELIDGTMQEPEGEEVAGEIVEEEPQPRRASRRRDEPQEDDPEEGEGEQPEEEEQAEEAEGEEQPEEPEEGEEQPEEEEQQPEEEEQQPEEEEEEAPPRRAPARAAKPAHKPASTRERLPARSSSRPAPGRGRSR